jgi:uncharacterized protein (TIGR02246 family)
MSDTRIRRIAANIAKLPGLLRHENPLQHLSISAERTHIVAPGEGFQIGGFAMKCITTLGAIALTIACFSFVASAQAQDTQEVTNAVKALVAQESEMWRNKDAAGVASLFTADAVLVMLAPKLAVKSGHDAIQKHHEGLFDAGATNLTMDAQHVEMLGGDAAWVAGTYSVTVKDKTIEGNWVRMLKREAGTWKVAMESFARAAIGHSSN